MIRKEVAMIVMILLITSAYAATYQDKTGKKYTQEEFDKLGATTFGDVYKKGDDIYTKIEDKPADLPKVSSSSYASINGQTYRITQSGYYKVTPDGNFYVDSANRVYDNNGKEIGTKTPGGLLHITGSTDTKLGYYQGSTYLGEKAGELNGKPYTQDANGNIKFIESGETGKKFGDNIIVTTTQGTGKDAKKVYTVYGKDGEEIYDGEDQVTTYGNGAFAIIDKNGKPIKDNPYRNPDGKPIPDGAVSDMDGGYYLKGADGIMHITPNQDGSYLSTWKSGSIFNTQHHFGTGCNPDGSNCLESVEMDRCVFQGGAICDKDGKTFDCSSGKCVEYDESQLSDGLVGGFGMYWFGNQLDLWQSATSGYNNLAGLFYTAEDADNQFGILDNEWAQTILGGIDGWTSMICGSQMTPSDSSGYAFSGNPGIEAYAHVEAERITYINYSDPESDVFYIYKITYDINPGEEDDHCNMEWNIFLDQTRLWSLNFDEDNYTNAIGTSAILDTSSRFYDKICIRFFSIRTGCLQGVFEGDLVCNRIADGGTNDAADFRFDCPTYGGWAGGCGDDDSGGSSGESSAESPSGSDDITDNSRRRTDL